MTKDELLKYLTSELELYRKDWREQLFRDRHMNQLERYVSIQNSKELFIEQDYNLKKLKNYLDRIPQEFVDALLVDFINHVGLGQGIDFGLYTKHLEELKRA